MMLMGGIFRRQNGQGRKRDGQEGLRQDGQVGKTEQL